MSHYNLYESLGLSRQASSEELAQKLDSRLSDLRKQGKEDSAPEVEEVATARRILGDSDLRRVHDSRLDDPSAPDIDIPALRELAASAGIAGAARHSATPDPEKTTKLNSEAGSSRVSAPYSQPSNPGQGSGYQPPQGQPGGYNGGWSGNGNGGVSHQPNQQPYGYPQGQPQAPQGPGFVQRAAIAADRDLLSLKSVFAKLPILPKVATIIVLVAAGLFALTIIVAPIVAKGAIMDILEFDIDLLSSSEMKEVEAALAIILNPVTFLIGSFLSFQALAAAGTILARFGEAVNLLVVASYGVVILGALVTVFTVPFAVSWTAIVVLIYAIAVIVLLLLPESRAWAQGKTVNNSHRQNNQFGQGQPGYGQPQYGRQQGW